ncbi:hypothetical protein KXD40_002467 [Peronospora effusa]|nr:hypothetical protein KXD40_002467 [Peronospora effusa]
MVGSMDLIRDQDRMLTAFSGHTETSSKRKGSAHALQWKRPRRSLRDKSEFVSVEVGMREFKKRLAATDVAESTTLTIKTDQVDEDFTQATPETRGKSKTAIVQKKSTGTSRSSATKMKKKTSMPVQRTTRASTRLAASTLSLAQVKLQLKLEQQERVEHRIQMLHCEEKPLAAASAVGNASALTPVRPETSVGAGGKTVIKAEIASKPMMSVENGAQTCTSSVLSATQIPSSTESVASSDLQLCPMKNEFIADDLEEDLMFAMALEETERKLATPQKPLLSRKVETTTDVNCLTAINPQVLVASPVPAILATAILQPAQVSTANQQQMTKTLVQSNQTEAIPEVLKEMERLRRENKLLRRSNELLQAAVTPPAQTKICSSSGHSNDQDGTALLPQDSSIDTLARTSTGRFLDLGRCDSDHERLSSWDDRQLQEHVTDSRSTASQTVPSEIQSEYLSSNDEKRLCDVQHKLEKENEPATEPDITKENASKLSHIGSPYNPVATSPLSSHSAPVNDNIHLSAQPTVTGYEPVQEGETASLRPLELSSSTECVIEDCAHATNGRDNGDISDVSVAEVDEEVYEDDEKEEEVVSDDGPTGRMSTIDCGNHAEYKVRQENDHDDADDENMGETRDNIIALEAKSDAEPALSTYVDSESSNIILNNEPAAWKAGPPTDNDILDRTTASSNSDDEGDNGEADLMSVNRRQRREAIALSSSSSESESESEEDETTSLNVLEAALHAAGGDRGSKNRAKSSSVVNSAVSDKQHETKDGSTAAVLESSLPSKSAKRIMKKRKTLGLSSASAKKLASTKSSLLWPALDDFYNYLLDMSPKNVRGSEEKRVHLRQYAGGKLPTQHSSIEKYCGVQLEAVMEELMASVSNTTDRKGGGGSRPTRHLPLTSVSPCGVQRGFTSSAGLSFDAIFSESGFTGSTSSSNDYVLTFDPPALGNNSSSEFLSGDLVLVRSPRWKKYEMCVFGVVLCGSLVAGGGKSVSRGNVGDGGPGNNDQICVLIRAHKRGQDDAVENFNVLTELCLSNQRVPKWRWSLQQVHNTTTSAREFQAIRAIPFFPSDLQQALLRGRLTMSTTKQTPPHSVAPSSVLSPRLLKYLRKHFNDSQVQAILGCLGEDSRVIIQGPPGTGKTKTILGLLSALLDGAGLSTLQKTKGTARIRAGASLQSARTSAGSNAVAGTSIRILVAAPSNAAVDELVVRVLSEGLFDGEKGESYRPQIVRVGRPESSQQLSSLAAVREASESKKNRKKMRKYAREVEEVLLESLVTKHRKTFQTVKQAREAIIKSAQIVFCTLSGAGSVAMCEFAQDFDALIIDEAAQAVEASTLIPFKFRPHRVVFVGDHRQLPATVISKELISMGYDRSLQQRLVENGSPVLLLTQQYRMHPEIAEFPSSYFYGGRLVQDDNMSEWTAQSYHCDPAFKPLLFYDVQGAQSQVSGSTSLRNMNEVEVVVQLVRRLAQQFPQHEWKKRIGVIAPYKQQICEVRNAMGKLEIELNCHLGIEVNTVDGFQGREKEIIIYSCVRTSHNSRTRRKKRRKENNDKDGNVLDAFWADERRMNVAITRAKSSLWIVGNSTLLTQSFAWKALIQHMKDHNRYISDSTDLVSANSSTRNAK